MPISIIILANCDAHLLEEMLPELMAQVYDDYEVIVVRESKKGTVTDLMEVLMKQYSNLKTTFLPDKPQYVTDYEVEIMLGVKAASNEHLIIIPAGFIPYSENWLNDCAIATGTDFTLKIGKCDYAPSTSFFGKVSHSRRLSKALNRWIKKSSLVKSEVMLPKNERQLFSIAFAKHDYLEDPLLRNTIFVHEDA